MPRSFIRNVGTGSIYNESGEIMAGQIVFCAGNSIPNGYLECNGATVSRTTYATLFAAIGSTYGAGDGATTFNLPDLRGEFIRGADRGRGVDSGRAVGSNQDHQFQDHFHTIRADVTNLPPNIGASEFSLGPANQVSKFIGSEAAQNGNRGSETRPRNIAMIAAIKYS